MLIFSLLFQFLGELIMFRVQNRFLILRARDASQGKYFFTVHDLNLRGQTCFCVLLEFPELWMHG